MRALPWNRLLGKSTVVFCLAAWLAPCLTAVAQGWSTENFNTNTGYARGFSLTDTNQPIALRWQGNDPFNGSTGDTDVVQRAVGYTPAPLANSSLIQGGSDVANGVLPGTNAVRLWRSFTPLGNPTVSFAAQWSIIPSLEGAPYDQADTFAFDLRNAANTDSLLTLQLTPGINILPNAYTLQTVAAGAPTSTLIDLGYQSLFQVQVDVTGSTYNLSLAQLNAADQSVIVEYILATNAPLSTGFTANDFGTVGIDWTLASGDPSSPGSNYIIVNDVSVVPEPTTYALILLFTSAWFAQSYIRRRRTSV